MTVFNKVNRSYKRKKINQKSSRGRTIKRQLEKQINDQIRCTECRTIVDAEGKAEILHCCSKHSSKLASLVAGMTSEEILKWFR